MDIRNMRFDYFETMLRARKGYTRVMDPICSQWDLTRNELDVLLFLYNNPGFDRASDVATRRGMAIRFAEDDLRSMGRTATGVKSITLRDEDYVVDMLILIQLMLIILLLTLHHMKLAFAMGMKSYILELVI